MALSNQFQFDPSMGDLVIQAFHMCGVRPAALTQEHMTSARMASNTLMGRFGSMGVNLWAVDLQTITLVAGTTTYSVPDTTVAILDAYTVLNSGTEAQTNRIILPVGRSEYAAFSNPLQQGAITCFWFNRQLSPEINFYQTPDGTQEEVQYWRLRQAMDSNLASGGNVEMPWYWVDCFLFGLAQRLAIMWAPDRAPGLKALADESYVIAAEQNTETAVTWIVPQLGNFYRP